MLAPGETGNVSAPSNSFHVSSSPTLALGSACPDRRSEPGRVRGCPERSSAGATSRQQKIAGFSLGRKNPPRAERAAYIDRSAPYSRPWLDAHARQRHLHSRFRRRSRGVAGPSRRPPRGISAAAPASTGPRRGPGPRAGRLGIDGRRGECRRRHEDRHRRYRHRSEPPRFPRRLPSRARRIPQRARRRPRVYQLQGDRRAQLRRVA